MLVGLALAAAVGCGGGGSNDEDEIKNVLTTSFTTVDPAQCQQLTEKGLQEIVPFVANADDPAKACRDALDPNSSPDSIKVSGLSVDGDQATAKVTPRAGHSGAPTSLWHWRTRTAGGSMVSTTSRSSIAMPI
jgi:hypothetical protein